MALSIAGHQTRTMAFYLINNRKGNEVQNMKTYFEFILLITLLIGWDNGQSHG